MLTWPLLVMWWWSEEKSLPAFILAMQPVPRLRWDVLVYSFTVCIWLENANSAVRVLLSAVRDIQLCTVSFFVRHNVYVYSKYLHNSGECREGQIRGSGARLSGVIHGRARELFSPRKTWIFADSQRCIEFCCLHLFYFTHLAPCWP